MDTTIHKKKGVTILIKKLWNNFVTYVINDHNVTYYAHNVI